MKRVVAVLLVLLIGGCGKGEPARGPGGAPAGASGAPEGVFVAGDTARVPGYATTYVDSVGEEWIESAPPTPEIERWLEANRYEYTGFEVDSVGTRELQGFGMEAEDSTREAVYGAGVWRR